MGLINRILSFTRTERNGAKVSEVKADPGGGANITADHFSAPGDDAFPLETDKMLSVPVPHTGREAAAGYVDPINEPDTVRGEKRIYGRDPETGAAISYVACRADGTLELNGSVNSAVAYAALLTAFNQLQTDVNALIVAYNTAVYTIGGVGTTGTTSAPATPSTADMTPAEVPEVKLP